MKRHKPIVYISGPITGNRYAETQFSAADSILDARGYEVVNPFQLGVLLPASFEHQDYMDIDMEILRKCEYIALMAGHEESKGCQIEKRWAINNGLGIIDGRQGFKVVKHPSWWTDEQMKEAEEYERIREERAKSLRAGMSGHTDRTVRR